MTANDFGGDWTLQKLEILRRYLDVYTTALKNQPFDLVYVDAFAGTGYWKPRSGFAASEYEDYQGLLEGSAALALEVRDKPFDSFVFVEADAERSESLRALRRKHAGRDIQVITEDANTALPAFCEGMGAYDRAVAFLDPFATQCSWHMVEAVARTRKIDCWILFPLSAISRLMPVGSEPPPRFVPILDEVFGGRDYWRQIYAPSPQARLFGDESGQERPQGSAGIAALYRKRLESAFANVAPTSRILRNSNNVPMFELFFAASNERGARPAVRIADYILKEW